MVTGIVLSGGGARGIAHLGVLQALDELGLSIDCLSGTSAGAICGALYAYGYKPIEILSQIERIQVFKSIRPAWARTGLLSMEGVHKILLEYMPENNFNALKKPLYVTATEIRKGESHSFHEGELIPPILASCCVPAIFDPVQINGHVYVDGGILDNLPVKCIKDRCGFIIGSHCNPIANDFDPKNLKMVVERSLIMAINGNTTLSKKMCDVLIEPPGLGQFSGFELAKAKTIFDMAYTYTAMNFTLKDFQLKFDKNTQ